MKNSSDKTINHDSEIALEMKLLILELDGISKNQHSERLSEIRSFLCNYAIELMRSNDKYCKLVA